jgi:hypothetical protein
MTMQPGALVLAAHQPGVAEEVAVLGETLDVLDLVNQDQAQPSWRPRRGPGRSVWTGKRTAGTVLRSGRFPPPAAVHPSGKKLGPVA